MEKLYTRKEAAELLGIGLSALDAARYSGAISYIQYNTNGCVYFTDAYLQEYVARNTHRATPINTSTTYRTPRKRAR